MWKILIIHKTRKYIMESIKNKMAYVNPKYLHVHDDSRIPAIILTRLAAKIATLQHIPPLVLNRECNGIIVGREIFMVSQMIELFKLPFVFYQSLTCEEFDLLLEEHEAFIKQLLKVRLDLVPGVPTFKPQEEK